ncbi:uncharacterized protein LOC100275335 [Zea mays]|uniref:Uncharacterized protein n=1 Tax=Zea mays TaxID=4577 RepID=B6SRG3_MAIZE|nr:uncharacterized protein LOC100275335 [Zea mays]ACG27446.1 hypothetical protein [Zea mays]ONM56434.1 hypothetical protein ZEAMMB73_Zm00001d021177 [Zea mays]|eukprot:NP_001142904.1 uncharacterized protein LOC100275335 [Zea mays]
MAHPMPPLSASQSTITTVLKILPKPPAAPESRSNNCAFGAKFDSRRALLCGLVAAAAAAGTMLGADIAGAASKRRPPPPAPAEAKKDPNVSGVQAKVLASRKRKEAMKEAVAKLREKGKPVDK